MSAYVAYEASVIEDETHLLISCSFYSDLRHKLFQNASDENTNFESTLVSEYGQVVPQSQTADKPTIPRGRATQQSRDTRKTN